MQFDGKSQKSISTVTIHTSWIELFRLLVKHSCLQHASMLECACHIISYLADVMNALRQSSGQGSSQLLMEGEEKAIEVDSDWVEDLAVEEEDSQAEDSVRKQSTHCRFKDC